MTDQEVFVDIHKCYILTDINSILRLIILKEASLLKPPVKP